MPISQAMSFVGHASHLIRRIYSLLEHSSSVLTHAHPRTATGEVVSSSFSGSTYVGCDKPLEVLRRIVREGQVLPHTGLWAGSCPLEISHSIGPRPT